MRGISKRTHRQKILPLTKLTGIVKVSREDDDDSFGDTYWTETFDLTARSLDGKKIFESFHVLAVPEGQFETFERLRRQVKQSLVSELEQAYQSSGQKD